MAESKRMMKTWGLFAAVAATGAIALSVASQAAPRKKVQPAATPEQPAVASKIVETLGSTRVHRVTQNPSGPTFPGGGVAGGGPYTFITGFETTDSPAYVVGPLAEDHDTGQNGWHIWNTMSTPPSPAAAADTSSSLAARVSDANPEAGTQHIRITNDPGLTDGTSVGVISSLLAPSAVAQSSLSADIYIDAPGGGQYNIRPRDTAGSDTVAANVVFAQADMMIGQSLTTAGGTTVEIGEKAMGNDPMKPDICVLEDGLSGLTFKCMGDWDPGAYRCFEVSVLPPVSGNPAEIEYRYGVRDMMGVCPLFHSDDVLVAADNVDSVHFRHNNQALGEGFMDIDNLSVEINLIPGACCTGNMCTVVTSDMCSIGDGKVFIGAGTDCTGVAGSPCENGRCCAADGGCTYGPVGGCVGTFFGGYPANICNINCCSQPTDGAGDCEDLTSIPVIPVPGKANYDGVPSANDPVDCPALGLTTNEYHWEAFTINSCANVEISYCCSGEATGEVRSPANNFIIADTGPMGGCPCDNATQLYSASAVNVGFGGTLPNKCADGNFHMRFVNLPPGTYYVPIFIEDTDPMDPSLVSPLEYQMQIETFPCPIGGCCTGNVCTNTNVVTCTQGGGNYLGDAVACTFACGTGACCRNDGSCTDATAFAACIGATQPTTYFGGTTCANANGGVCPPNNDRCGFAATLNNGVNPFTNVGAIADGPNDFCQTSATTQDVWYNYTATCNGDVTISLCGFSPDFDTVISAYTDTTCPIDSSTRVACNDDFDCGGGAPTTGTWSEITFPATNGQQFKVRVGSWLGGGESGAGEIVVSCTASGAPCTTAADCRNDGPNNACNCATCPAGTCVYTCARFGNSNCAGPVNLDDILCTLAGFSNFAACVNGDVAPCGGNGIINLDDILATLAAFGGANPCGCTENSAPGTGVPPLCGSNAP